MSAVNIHKSVSSSDINRVANALSDDLLARFNRRAKEVTRLNEVISQEGKAGIINFPRHYDDFAGALGRGDVDGAIEIATDWKTIAPDAPEPDPKEETAQIEASAKDDEQDEFFGLTAENIRAIASAAAGKKLRALKTIKAEKNRLNKTAEKLSLTDDEKRPLQEAIHAGDTDKAVQVAEILYAAHNPEPEATDEPAKEKPARKKRQGKKFAGKVLRNTGDTNPRREGTWGWKSWNIIQEAGPDGISFEDYASKGGRSNDLDWDIKKGNTVIE